MAKTVVRFPAAKSGPPPMTIGVSKLPQLLGISPRNLRTVMADPGFPSRFKIGKRDFVLVHDLEQWLTSRIEAGTRRAG